MLNNNYLIVIKKKKKIKVVIVRVEETNAHYIDNFVFALNIYSNKETGEEDHVGNQNRAFLFNTTHAYFSKSLPIGQTIKTQNGNFVNFKISTEPRSHRTTTDTKTQIPDSSLQTKTFY